MFNKIQIISILLLAGILLPIYSVEANKLFGHSARVSASIPKYQVVPIPVRINTSTRPALFNNDEVAYAVDLNTMTPLYQQSANKRLPIASLTKLMTAVIMLNNHKTTDLVTIPNLPPLGPDDQQLGLKPGQVFTVGDLLKAMLIASEDDVANALALYDAGSIDAFTIKMDQELTKWGIPYAHYSNASGLGDINNYSNAVSIAKIDKVALQNPIISDYVSTQAATILDTIGDNFDLVTTDQLLATGHFYGIKTGYTQAAGECFTGLADIDGHLVITVILNSKDRFGDTLTLVNWIKGAWKWQ